jgi:alpha/beta hydrolase family protein
LSSLPLIIFVPGLRPKPEPKTHRLDLLRSLHEGIARFDVDCAEDLQSHPESFELIAWTYSFYGEHQDSALDRPGIEALLKVRGASDRDRSEAGSLQHRFLKLVYRLADRLPFDVPALGSERLELHLRDLRRYVRNADDIADRTRAMLQQPLLKAAREGRPILLIGHSMGCIISYDALWQLSYAMDEPFGLDTLLTLGSPLGQNFIRRRLLGHDQQGPRRYPGNIQHWTNIAAVGDLTALEMTVNDRYSEMLELGLIDSIEDHTIYNWYRDYGTDGKLNIHSEYGYLINETTAAFVADWWAAKRDLRAK